MDSQSGNSSSTDITTTFNICLSSDFELDMSWVKSIGTVNYLFINEVPYFGLVSKDNLFDEIIILDFPNGYPAIEQLIRERLVDPKKTRIICWSDEDLIVGARLREIFGIPGDNIEETSITFDKHKLKPYLKKAGVKCADFVHFKQIKQEDIEALVEEVEAKIKLYPMFGKPTNLNGSRCTANINNQAELRKYLVYTMGYPDLEFMIETFLEGKHCEIEAIIKNGKQDLSLVQYFATPIRNGLLAEPICCQLVLPDSEIYLKAHAALNRLLPHMPNLVNGTIFMEFVYMNDDVYVMEACRRKSGMPWMILYYRQYGINFEEAYFKLAIDRFDFYTPETLVVSKHIGFVFYIKKTGKIIRKCDLPPLSSQVSEIEFSKVGDKSVCSSTEKNDQYPEISKIEVLENDDYEKLSQELVKLLTWQPFEYELN